jgi:hypothetical protein
MTVHMTVAEEGYLPAFKAGLDMITAQGGIVGWVVDCEQVTAALGRAFD